MDIYFTGGENDGGEKRHGVREHIHDIGLVYIGILRLGTRHLNWS